MSQSMPSDRGRHRRRANFVPVVAGAIFTAVALGFGSIGRAVPAEPQTKPAKPPKAKPKPKPTPGGANQVKGKVTGKLGEMLFDGKWRFQVISVGEATNTYTLTVPSSEQDYGKYATFADGDITTHVFTAKPGNVLIPIKCLAKNGQNKVEQLDFYLHDPKTALTDDKGNSYPPIAYDMQSKGAWVTKPMLPGSQVEMTILFAPPSGTKPKDLVVTIKNWSDSKGTDFRISLDNASAPPPK